MNAPGHASTDLVVDSVDWLPSGADSGLVRVRGHSVSGSVTALPQLVVEGTGEPRRLSSLPDPRAMREPGTWRGAFVLDVRPAAEERLWLSWPDGARVDLPGLVAPAPSVASEGGEVVDRTVLAERRVRRAEASEQAQSRIAAEALRAVEVLELRTSEVERERDELREQLAGRGSMPSTEAEREVERLRTALDLAQRDAAVEVAKLHTDLEDARAALSKAPTPADAAGATEAERLGAALTEALARAEAAEAASPDAAALDEAPAEAAGPDAEAFEALRGQVAAAEARAAAAAPELARLRAELDRATAARPAQTDTEQQRAAMIAERRAVRLRSALTTTIATVAELRLRLHEADVARRTREVGHSADAVRLTILDAEHGRLVDELEIRRTAMEDLAAAQAALDDLRALHAEQGAALATSAARVGELEAELVAARAEAERAVSEAIASTRLVAEAAAAERAAEQIAAAQALTDEAQRVAEELQTELADAQTAREVAEAGAAAAHVVRAAAGVAHASPVGGHTSLSEQLERARESLRAARAAAAESAAQDRWAPPIAAMQAAAEAPAAAETPAAGAPRPATPADVSAGADPEEAPAAGAALDEAPSVDVPAEALVAGEGPSVAAPVEEAVLADAVAEATSTDAPVDDPLAEEPPPSREAPAPYDSAAMDAFIDAAIAPDPVAFSPPVAPEAADEFVLEEVPHDDDAVAAETPQATRSPIAPFPLELLGAADRQAGVTERAQPTEEQAKVVADLDAAASALRQRPEITSPADDPPNDLARERGSREYPMLRGALVKLAHDDATAAASLMIGLLSAKHTVLGDPLDWDLTITELGTFAVRFAQDETAVTPLDQPRGRPHAAFHTRGDALSVAEALAGVGDRPSRMRGGLRTSGRVRDARRLLAVTASPPSLPEMLAAGAQLDPALVVQAFTYTVPAAWTADQSWSVDCVVDGTPLGIVAQPSGGLVCDRPGGEPDARIHLDAQGFRDLVAGVDQPLRIDGDKATVGRLLALVARVRK